MVLNVVQHLGVQGFLRGWERAECPAHRSNSSQGRLPGGADTSVSALTVSSSPPGSWDHGATVLSWCPGARGRGSAPRTPSGGVVPKASVLVECCGLWLFGDSCISLLGLP